MSRWPEIGRHHILVTNPRKGHSLGTDDASLPAHRFVNPVARVDTPSTVTAVPSAPSNRQDSRSGGFQTRLCRRIRRPSQNPSPATQILRRRRGSRRGGDGKCSAGACPPLRAPRNFAGPAKSHRCPSNLQLHRSGDSRIAPGLGAANPNGPSSKCLIGPKLGVTIFS